MERRGGDQEEEVESVVEDGEGVAEGRLTPS